ncbi:MAG: bifunctional diaminohydroxyphosphoribosylaminopyrimidine deaminase/5-amino-6-(5-phosphoribosylamino)uracil reductase RibD [Parvibaculaceae bacterium]|nr:bifunctional diaminohydroxyphosphoribosylaminopyrimidine deaminase/5-amino-6-(5-phosphoribosylamino)uracil reductase RibD [Parvibaculaceae bacterium]
MIRPHDMRFMKLALNLAVRGLGQVAPNPAVGCVIVREEEGEEPRIVGRGWTQAGGRPHAETEALVRAGDLARGATAYVTLEPCSHHGKTPPCAEALIAAGIRRVVAAIGDPDPRVSGRGFSLLRGAGIEVVEGVCAAEAAELNRGFLLKVTEGRPMVLLKVASTLDGKTAMRSGESMWITGPAARRRGHLSRALADAIMVGSLTAIMDDPELTCRLPGLEGRSPVRIVADSHLRLPLTSKLVQQAGARPLWLVVTEGCDPVRRAAYEGCGVRIITAPASAGDHIDVAAALREFGRLGLTRLLVEGGSQLAAALLRAGLVDRIDWYFAGKLIGSDGHPAIASLGIENLIDVPRFELKSLVPLDGDVLARYSAQP